MRVAQGSDAIDQFSAIQDDAVPAASRTLLDTLEGRGTVIRPIAYLSGARLRSTLYNTSGRISVLCIVGPPLAWLIPREFFGLNRCRPSSCTLVRIQALPV